MSARRYTKVRKLGEGAQGIVYLGEIAEEVDDERKRKLPSKVALKRYKLQQGGYGVDLATIREIMHIQELHHPNILTCFDVYREDGDIYAAVELMNTDLEVILRDRQNIALDTSHVKRFMMMILKAVSYCHKRFILHRDLKPANCLIGKDRVLKLADFGLAREFGSPSREMSPQACTIWYRAPELLFGSKTYVEGADIWSIGCIFAELMLRVPLFPGSSELDQLTKIFTCFGTPSEKNWPGLKLLPYYHEFTECDPVNLRDLFQAATPMALDLFRKLMAYDPKKRISCDKALKHPYFTEAPLPSPIEKLPLPPKCL